MASICLHCHHERHVSILTGKSLIQSKIQVFRDWTLRATLVLNLVVLSCRSINPNVERCFLHVGVRVSARRRFFLLHQFFVVATWAAMETSVYNMCVGLSHDRGNAKRIHAHTTIENKTSSIPCSPYCVSFHTSKIINGDKACREKVP